MELVPTDQEALQSLFQGIPSCTDADDGPALSAALLEAVQKLAIQENGGSPEHNFFIGLAYLNGIDVEVDRERALSLITGAAEAGLPEAMEKLVNMYRSGGGVTRDYHTAVQWQERLAACWQMRYEESGTLSDGLLCGVDLGVLGGCQEELADLTAAKQSYQQLRDVNQQLSAQYDDVSIWQNLSVSYHYLGSISQAEDRLAEAKEYYLESLELRRQLYEETRTVQALSDLAADYYNIGTASDPVEGDSMLLQAFHIWNQLCKQYPNVPLYAHWRDTVRNLLE